LRDALIAYFGLADESHAPEASADLMIDHLASTPRGERVFERLDRPGHRANGTLHRHHWTWAEPLGLPGQHVTWCLDCGQRKQSRKGWLQDPLCHPGEGE
jgi:hypothetical protein